MLTDTDLADMRAAISELLPARCNVLTVTRTSDGQGGQVDTWGTVTANVPCRLDYGAGDIRGAEILSGNAIQSYSGWILSVPFGTAISEVNRVQLGGVLYNVTIADNEKSWGVVLRVALDQV